MSRRLAIALDWCADHIGDAYLLVLAAVVVASLGVVLISAVR